MFDPTAFDNMKVVVEGAIYDIDLAGKIVIIDRNDIVNLAKMSRSFDVSFTLPDAQVTAVIEISSNIINLAAELLPNSLAENQSGCYIQLKFNHNGITDATHLNKVERILLEIWGGTRKISQSVTINHTESEVYNVHLIELDRLVREDQILDLVELIDSMVLTLENIEDYLSKINLN
ncbi:hypothetical protein [Bacillus sp. OK048]|uniref:hypothetical protein n=1 Tax=Bacillus sp. OK048 TaxID=1882761 RepID=UPI000886ADD2|nr:hypothetical protein [Bacillus sp. OK048]SDL92430.1 hypothetical protein SAMN05443253_101175 [Bacillus sp. OK048]